MSENRYENFLPSDATLKKRVADWENLWSKYAIEEDLDSVDTFAVEDLPIANNNDPALNNENDDNSDLAEMEDSASECDENEVDNKEIIKALRPIIANRIKSWESRKAMQQSELIQNKDSIIKRDQSTTESYKYSEEINNGVDTNEKCEERNISKNENDSSLIKNKGANYTILEETTVITKTTTKRIIVCGNVQNSPTMSCLRDMNTKGTPKSKRKLDVIKDELSDSHRSIQSNKIRKCLYGNSDLSTALVPYNNNKLLPPITIYKADQAKKLTKNTDGQIVLKSNQIRKAISLHDKSLLDNDSLRTLVVPSTSTGIGEYHPGADRETIEKFVAEDSDVDILSRLLNAPEHPMFSYTIKDN